MKQHAPPAIIRVSIKEAKHYWYPEEPDKQITQALYLIQVNSNRQG